MSPRHHGEEMLHLLAWPLDTHTMSRTTLGLIVAAALTFGSLAIMAVRFGTGSWGPQLLAVASLHQLESAEQELVEVLLLLPLTALVICVYRNVIGLTSFGTFTPALIGLAFRDMRSWPGVPIFVGLLLVGWGLRRVLERLHLLQVPRISLMLSVIISLLVVLIVVANRLGWPATRFIALFPLIVLTGMIERFILMEEEEGAYASLRTLAATMLIAGTISLIISQSFVPRWLMTAPESLGLIMAAQLLLGRYTGYRLTELYRFRALLKDETQHRVPEFIPPVGDGSTKDDASSQRRFPSLLSAR